MTTGTRWAHAWSIAAAVGVGFASLQWSPIVVVLDLLATAVGAAICLVIYEEWRPPPGTSRAPSRRLAETTRRSLVVSCWVVALSTLTVASPPLALLVLLLVGATSPVVVGLVRSRSPERRLPAAAEAPAAEVPAAEAPAAEAPVEPLRAGGRSLEQLDDDELFRLWRHTFWELNSQPSVGQLASLVALRQSCLDELARRDPAALSAWLDSGARASGGPERFWGRPQEHGGQGECR